MISPGKCNILVIAAHFFSSIRTNIDLAAMEAGAELTIGDAQRPKLQVGASEPRFAQLLSMSRKGVLL